MKLDYYYLLALYFSSLSNSKLEFVVENQLIIILIKKNKKYGLI